MNVVTFSNFYFRDRDQRLPVVVVKKRLVLLAFRMMIATHQQ